MADHLSTTEKFVRWARQHWPDPEIESDVIETLLKYKRDYLEADSARWEPGDLTRLLLDVIPRKVTTDNAYVAAVAPTISAYIAFLRSDPSTHRDADILDDDAQLALPQFPAAMADPTRWGMAKTMAMNMAAEGFDPSDQAALEEWMADFNSRPFEEREALTGGPHPPWRPDDEPFPTVRLAPRAALADEVRRIPYLMKLGIVRDWLGDRRQVTNVGWPRVADGKELAVELGLVTPEELTQRAVRSAADIPGMVTIWNLATGSNILEVRTTRVYEGISAAALSGDATDDQLLDFFERLFLTATSLASDQVEIGLSAIEHVVPLLTMIYPEPATWTEAKSYLADRETQEFASILGTPVEPSMSQRFYAQASLELDDLLPWLIELGILQDSREELRLSPIGMWAVNKALVAAGHTAPAVEPLAGESAAKLLAVAAELSLDDWAEERRAWLAARDPELGARDLLAAAAACGDPGQRLMAIEIFTEIGQPAVGPLRERLEDPVIWRHAVQAMELIGVPSPKRLNDKDRAWLMTESLAVSDTPDQIVDMLPDDEPAELEAMFEHVWRSGHPQAADTLERIGRHHPDRQVAKSARKAAFKARSRGA